MSRAERLLDLLQILRQHRYPVSGKVLAEQLNISLRTLYRDIATLQSQGACIEGEAGMGYVLRPGFILPPLMFSEEEIEALVLGSKWVAKRADSELKEAAQNALAKISSVLPDALIHKLESSALLVGPPKVTIDLNHSDEALIREAIRKEYMLEMTYKDVNGKVSERVIFPLALGFFDDARIIVAMCELRQDFRHFRTDRIVQLKLIKKHFTERRQALLKQWRKIHNIPEQ